MIMQIMITATLKTRFGGFLGSSLHTIRKKTPVAIIARAAKTIIGPNWPGLALKAWLTIKQRPIATQIRPIVRSRLRISFLQLFIVWCGGPLARRGVVCRTNTS